MALNRKSLLIPENVKGGMREVLKKVVVNLGEGKIFPNDSKSRSNRAKTGNSNVTKFKTFMWGKKTPKFETPWKSICH